MRGVLSSQHTTTIRKKWNVSIGAFNFGQKAFWIGPFDGAETETVSTARLRQTLSGGWARWLTCHPLRASVGASDTVMAVVSQSVGSAGFTSIGAAGGGGNVDALCS